jgi:hypothetical protein
MENLLRPIEIQQGEGHDYLKKCTNYTYESRCFDASHFWLHWKFEYYSMNKPCSW